MLVFKRGIREPLPKRPSIDSLHARAHLFFKQHLDHFDSQRIWLAGQKIPDLNARTLFYAEAVAQTEQQLSGETTSDLQDYIIYKYKPVSIEQFICDPYYLNKEAEIYPGVLAAAIELNNGLYVEALLTGGIGSGKALALDTPIPTPQGWACIGDLQDGDQLYDESGAIHTIVKAHPVLMGRPCYRITFSDDTQIVADAEHLWQTWTTTQRANKTHSSIRTTAQIQQTVKKRHAIEIAKPLRGREIVRLGVDPYTLGIWLGDGSSDSGQVWCADAQVLDEIGRHYTLTEQERPEGCLKPHTVHGLRKSLGRMGLLGNKHIPPRLLRASYQQRLALLQGLMDSDGTADKKSGRCSFTNVNKILAQGVAELVRTLGWKPSFKVRDAKLYGAFVSLAYTVAWSPNDDRPVFRLERKRVRQAVLSQNRETSHASWRMIESVEPVKSVPVRCLTVDSPSQLYLAGEGMIPTHNTTLALYTNAYQLYLLSCMRSPHKLFKLDPASEILLIFQSITKVLAQGVDYQRFRSMIQGSQYFAQQFPFDKKLESKLVFPNRIEVHPVAGTETAAIGQNVMGGLIDELNYMAIIEKSRASVDRGTYDQAIAVYNSISRRRKSRFMENGKLPGILCLVSSKKYPGQFTDQKMEEAEKDPTIFVYDKRVWDIKPDDFGSQGWFRVFTGDLTRKPRILDEGESVSDEDRAKMIVAVPNEFKIEFQKDVINALREIAGCSTLARHPFFLEVNKVNDAFKKEHPSIFSQTPVDFVATRLTLIKHAFFKPELPRFVHIDLALTGDSAGLAIGTVTGFKDVSVDKKHPAYMPELWYDGVLEIRAPRNSEILFSKIREVLLVLQKMGLNLCWVTFDQYQSSDSQQILRQWGLLTGHQSMDDVPCRPYDFLKTAMYEDRVNLPIHLHLQKEMLSLEKDTRTGKVDHPPSGSKDCISGETLVNLLSGGSQPIKKLVGKEVWVYSAQSDGRVVPALALNIHQVGLLSTVRVYLETGAYIDCTPDHEFMLRDGTYQEASRLLPGQSLMPLYKDVSSADSRSALNGYELIWCNQLQKFVFTHQRVAEEMFGFTYGNLLHQRQVIHHDDFDKRNNAPTNLIVMGWDDHRDLHNKVGATNLKKLQQNSVFQIRNKIRSAAIGKLTGPRNITKYNQSAARIAHLRETGQFSRNGTKVMQTLWSDPSFRQRQKERMSGSNNPYARKDITFDAIVAKASQVSSLNELYSELHCTQKVVYRVLREHEMTTTALRDAHFNHKVSYVQYLGYKTEMYDLTVDGLHNFAVGQGIFVHNCSDAVAGVCYGLTMRRDIWGLYHIPTAAIPLGIMKAADKLVKKVKPDYQDVNAY